MWTVCKLQGKKWTHFVSESQAWKLKLFRLQRASPLSRGSSLDPARGKAPDPHYRLGLRTLHDPPPILPGCLRPCQRSRRVGDRIFTDNAQTITCCWCYLYQLSSFLMSVSCIHRTQRARRVSGEKRKKKEFLSGFMRN